MTEFEKGYEQGFNEGRASKALPNIIDNGDKIDGYSYMYKTDSSGEPYIHINSVRGMLKKAADEQPMKHGRWENEYLDDDIWWTECSNCKEETHSRFGRVSSYAFCPNCGADMRKENTND